jgi:hypothetical protein
LPGSGMARLGLPPHIADKILNRLLEAYSKRYVLGACLGNGPNG